MTHELTDEQKALADEAMKETRDTWNQCIAVQITDVHALADMLDHAMANSGSVSDLTLRALMNADETPEVFEKLFKLRIEVEIVHSALTNLMRSSPLWKMEGALNDQKRNAIDKAIREYAMPECER